MPTLLSANRRRLWSPLAQIAAAGSVMFLAGCETDALASSGETEPTASAAAVVAVDRNDVIDVLMGFDPEIEGLERVSRGGGPPVDSAAEFSVPTAVVVDPIECLPVHEAINLATSEDRGDAADDVFRIVGYFNLTGEDINERLDPDEPLAWIMARWFADASLAESLVAEALAATCTAETATLPEYNLSFGANDIEVEQVLLAGLDAPSLRITLDDQFTHELDDWGAVAATHEEPPMLVYVHVKGHYAAQVELTNVDGSDETAARIFAEFVEAIGSVA